MLLNMITFLIKQLRSKNNYYDKLYNILTTKLSHMLINMVKVNKIMAVSAKLKRSEYCIWDNLVMTKKRKPTKKNLNLFIAAENNGIRTNYIKGKIDNMQQNSKCIICGDREEIANHILSQCSKLVHNWMGKVNHWELCKRLRFEHTTK